MTILGTGAGNEVTFTGSTTSAGDATVEVDNRAVVELENFDNDSTVVLDTGSGDDQIDITVNAATFFDNIDVLAGNPAASDKVIINSSGDDENEDEINVTDIDVGSATITGDGLASNGLSVTITVTAPRTS